MDCDPNNVEVSEYTALYNTSCISLYQIQDSATEISQVNSSATSKICTGLSNQAYMHGALLFLLLLTAHFSCSELRGASGKLSVRR